MVRVKLLYVLFFIIGICIFARIIYIQYGPEGDKLRQKAETANFTLVRVDAARGEIITAGGELLATSVQKYYVGIDFCATGLKEDVFEAGVDGLAEGMARLMKDRSKAQYKTLLQNGWKDRAKTRYRRLTNRLITYDELQELKTFPLMCLPANRGGRAVEVVTDRVRPYGRLAERTVGRTRETRDTIFKPGKDPDKVQKTIVLTERGQTGIEFSFDDQLKGKNGWMLKQKITEQFYIPVPDSELNVEPVNGRDVVTTLDMDFQDVAEAALEAQLLRFNGLFGTVVLMEVGTGEIKAISNLTNRAGYCVEDSNYAIGGLFEPGSTFKLTSLLALLESGMNLSDPVYVGNGYRELPGGKPIRDDHAPEAATLTLKRVFETSSNVGFVQATEKRFVETKREKDYIDYAVTLGLDRPLGTGMVGEAVPKFHKPTPEEKKDGRWHRNSLAYMSHGYGIEISPLHTLMVYNAVANGGRMVKPQLIRELREQGETVRRFATEVVNPAIAPARTIKAVRECLEGVVDEGTATVLKNPYYRVAAKTGTAQMLVAGLYRGSAGRHYLATMVGYFPADDPKYSCIVCIATRTGSGNWNYYGSSLAGPVFKAVADRVYVTRCDLQQPVNRTMAKSGQPPAIKGGPERSVRRAAKEFDIRVVSDSRRGEWVQTRRDTVAVTATTLDVTGGKVPQVTGMGLRDALYLLESRGLKADFTGRGKVVSQFPKAGEDIHRGATVTLSLK